MIKEWHPKNDFQPSEVCPSSKQKVWWICKRGHEWNAAIYSRVEGNGCPFCSLKKVCYDNCLATMNPKLAEEWDQSKNHNLTPSEVTHCSGLNVWWRCQKGHLWKATVGNRSRGNGCPYCCGRYATRETSLALQNAQLAKEWNVTRNGILTPFDVKRTSHKKVWWDCFNGHTWKAQISNRHNGKGCPYCAGQKICDDNCLATNNPGLVQEWHPTKNGDLTPKDVMPSSGKKRWWLCARGHEWEVSPNKRTSSGDNCPYCCNQRVCLDNCLLTMNPQLAKEWHPIKNENLTPGDVTPGTGKKVWWICQNGHEWEAVVASRSTGIGCPHCFYKTEEKCRLILERLFNKPFPRVRPFLKRGIRLELDGYCEEIEVAFEYNGEQHYKRHPLWHRKNGSFEKQQDNDRLKARLCEEKGIELIVVPYTENHKLEEFLQKSVNALNVQ